MAGRQAGWLKLEWACRWRQYWNRFVLLLHCSLICSSYCLYRSFLSVSLEFNRSIDRCMHLFAFDTLQRWSMMALPFFFVFFCWPHCYLHINCMRLSAPDVSLAYARDRSWNLFYFTARIHIMMCKQWVVWLWLLFNIYFFVFTWNRRHGTPMEWKWLGHEINSTFVLFVYVSEYLLLFYWFFFFGFGSAGRHFPEMIDD